MSTPERPAGAPQAPPAKGAQEAPRTAPPADMFGNRRTMGGLGMPTQKAKDFKGTARRLSGYLRPHRPALVVLTIAGAIGTVFTVVGPKILGLATTKVFEGFVAKAAGVPGASVDFAYVGRILLQQLQPLLRGRRDAHLGAGQLQHACGDGAHIGLIVHQQHPQAVQALGMLR